MNDTSPLCVFSIMKKTSERGESQDPWLLLTHSSSNHKTPTKEECVRLSRQISLSPLRSRRYFATLTPNQLAECVRVFCEGYMRERTNYSALRETPHTHTKGAPISAPNAGRRVSMWIWHRAKSTLKGMEGGHPQAD